MLDYSIIRPVVSSTALTGVPVLLILACRGWATRQRVTLPSWRNGIGLTSVSLLVLAWMWFAIGLADTQMTLRLGAMFFDLTVLSVIFTYAATAFACAWKGHCRVGVLAACILMGVGWRFFGYT